MCGWEVGSVHLCVVGGNIAHAVKKIFHFNFVLMDNKVF